MTKKLYACAIKNRTAYRLYSDEVIHGRSKRYKIVASSDVTRIKRESGVERGLDFILLDIAPLIDKGIIPEESVFKI